MAWKRVAANLYHKPFQTLGIHRALSLGAMHAEVIRTSDLDRTDYGKKGFAAQLLETRLLTA